MKSEICLADREGHVEVVLTSDMHLEAPNWHPEGYLIVNGGGAIYRLPFEAPELQRIDTGFAVRCNNDHGLSPDGRLLAISDSSEQGKSCIYILPVTGGTPERVTPEVPSWWHGWAPDGKRLAYVGARDGGPILLHTCSLDGSDEVCLTPGFDHVDGPDYTPDGAWIWFNGEKDGAVDLWRVRPDGRDLQRMTEGPDVDWFPHPSPSGDVVLFLAFPPGTKGHPAGLDVRLRLIPAGGGEPRDAVQIFGGQGSINVPCWAPDGSRFAFVRYSA